MNWRMLMLLAAVLALAACSPKHKTEPGPVSEPVIEEVAAPDTLDYDFLGEEVPDVVSEPDEEAAPDLPVVSEPETAPAVPVAEPEPLAPAVAQAPAGDGLNWVQIFATGSEEKAQELARKAQQRLSYRVAVHELPPYWKVLVGGFETREEAVQLRDRLVALGYDDAWIFKP